MFSVVVAHNKHGVKFTSSSISVYAFFALLVSSFTSSRSFYPLLLERILHRRYIYYTHNSLNGIQNIHDHHHRPTKVSKKKTKERKKRKEKAHTRAAVADQDEFKRWHFPSCRGHVIM